MTASLIIGKASLNIVNTSLNIMNLQESNRGKVILAYEGEKRFYYEDSVICPSLFISLYLVGSSLWKQGELSQMSCPS